MWPSLLCNTLAVLSCVMVRLDITLGLALVVAPNLYKLDTNFTLQSLFLVDLSMYKCLI